MAVSGPVTAYHGSYSCEDTPLTGGYQTHLDAENGASSFLRCRYYLRAYRRVAALGQFPGQTSSSPSTATLVCYRARLTSP